MEEMRERVKSEEGKRIYAKQKAIIEPLLGHLKHNLNFRMFLRRGKKEVEVEWILLCIGFNIRKLARLIVGKLLSPGRKMSEWAKERVPKALKSALYLFILMLKKIFLNNSVPLTQPGHVWCNAG